MYLLLINSIVVIIHKQISPEKNLHKYICR